MTSARTPRRVVLIVNPTARRAERARRALARRLSDAGLPPLGVLGTTVVDPGVGQARTAIEQGADLVVAAGGDGTVREVAGVLAGSGVELGILPLGTANLFARNLGLPMGVDNAVTALLTRPARPVDLGRATLDGVSHPFLVVAGIGNDATTVMATHAVAKASLGWLAYLHSGARHLSAPHRTFTLVRDASVPVDVTAWTVLFANCGRLPAGITVVPDARVDDGLLDVLVASTAGREWVSAAYHGLTGTPERGRGLAYSRVRTAVVEPSHATAVQLDGDAFPAVHRLSVTLEPGSLLVRY